jgi:glycosyltransferase involved in cell wall biosynthesis
MNKGSDIIASIVVPTRNSSLTVRDCIASLLASKCDFPFEILVLDGDSEDDTRSIVEGMASEDGRVQLLRNPNKTVPWAVNIAVEKSAGDYIFLASAHSRFPADYLASLVDLASTSGADCVGAVGSIVARNGGKKAAAIAAVLSDRFGVGNALFRIGVAIDQSVDTVAYGCYPRRTFQKYGLFDTRLTRNQDIEYNKRIVNGGGEIILTPRTHFVYMARDTYADLAENNFSNGKWAMITPALLHNLKSESLRHYVPFLFILSLFVPLIASIFYTPLLVVPLCILTIYFSFGVYRSALICIRNRSNIFPYLLWAFFVLHFSYGLGSLAGAFTLLKRDMKLYPVRK